MATSSVDFGEFAELKMRPLGELILITYDDHCLFFELIGMLINGDLTYYVP